MRDSLHKISFTRKLELSRLIRVNTIGCYVVAQVRCNSAALVSAGGAKEREYPSL